MKQTIAAYKSLKYGNTLILAKFSPDDSGDSDPEYLRLTDWLEVDLPELSRDVTVANEIAALDKVRASIVDEFSGKLASIDRRKSELLALPSVQS